MSIPNEIHTHRSKSWKSDEKRTEDEGCAGERMVPEVVPLPRFPLKTSLLFNKSGSINIKNLKAHLLKEGRLQKQDALKIIKTASGLFNDEPNLLRLRDPIAICGDIHGQFFDLLRLMETAGNPARTKYLFLGDYVDRGQFSTEVLFYLFAHKIMYHRTFFMIRGNHECRHLTQFFNFKEECIYKYDVDIWEAVMNAFDNLPLAATINHKFLCIHGGLSPDISTLKEIQDLNRRRETPREGPFCDLLWADPYDEQPKAGANNPDDQRNNNKQAQLPTTWFSYNETRQCSYVFGIDATKQFLKRNSLTAIIRAHEAQVDGYKFSMTNGQIPRVVTIFSAPNYCDVYKNKGACLQFYNDQLKIRQFGSSPHPYYLPNFMDVFTWSLPFMSEKVTDMVYHMLEYGRDEDQTDVPGSPRMPNEKSATEGIDDLMVKLNALARFRWMAKTLKKEKNKIVKLKALSPNRNLPCGLLFQGSSAIDLALSKFEDVRQHDLPMEAMPTTEGKPGVPGKLHKRLSGRSFSFKGIEIGDMGLISGLDDDDPDSLIDDDEIPRIKFSVEDSDYEREI